MGDELRHLNSACGCVIPEDECCEENNTCGGLGGNWLWIAVILFFFCCCGNGNGNGICGITSCSIDCTDLITIILILLFLNCLCNDGSGNGLLSGLFG